MIFLFILQTFFLHAKDVFAGPLPPLHPTFAREIDLNGFTQRSEWSIIWSCFATLFACSWVAIHPDIPAPSDSLIRIFARRLMIMGLMLVVPEFVIIWASRQWYSAHDIAKRHKGRGWGKTHGFFALMGGFILYKNGVMTETLRIERLERLASEDKIDWPIISEKEIEDRSKGDVFSKGFAVLQTTWFIVQCIARGVAGLTITQLEVATLAFAVLNGILYFLWWNKPQDVSCPVLIHLRHPTTSDPARSSSKRETGIQTMDADSEYKEISDHDISPIVFDSSLSMRKWAGNEEPGHEDDSHSATKEIGSIPSEPLSSTPFQRRSARHFRDCYWPIVSIIETFLIFVSPMDNCNSVIKDENSVLSIPRSYTPLRPQDDRSFLIGMGVGTLFGGIHCIAWSFHFPSFVELQLWRNCAIMVTNIPLIMTSVIALPFLVTLDSVASIIRSVKSSFGFSEIRSRNWEYSGRPHERTHVLIALFCTAFFTVVPYFVSRAVLLVLPLLALRSLPSDALLDIQWSTYIPHAL